MHKPLILNPILTRQYRQEQKEYLKAKICQMKPIVDNTCPESFFYLQNKFSKTQKNNYWNGTKTNMSPIFFKRIKIKPKVKKNQLKTKYRPLFKYDHDFLSYWRKAELINVAMENLNIYNRLNSKKGTYTLKNHLRDYERAQYYKKNYCKFPSIDFYRTRKTNNESLCSIFNYCTFYNYKTINEKLTNECLKRTNSQIMHKTRSVSDLFNIEKNRKKIFHLSPFRKKYKNEEQKSCDKNEIHNRKIIFNNAENNIYYNSGNNQNVKNEEVKREYFTDNKYNDVIDEKENNNEEENYNSNNTLDKKDEDIINTNDNKDMIINSNNKGDSEYKEEISEKIEGEEDKKEQDKYKQYQDEIESLKRKQNINAKIIDNNEIKEESEIEESINNEKNQNKKEMDDIKKEEKKEDIAVYEGKNKSEENNMNDADKFVSDILKDE